jgi:uncharacterized membrane protein YfcA
LQICRAAHAIEKLVKSQPLWRDLCHTRNLCHTIVLLPTATRIDPSQPETVLNDPLFLVMCIGAVTLLGLAKGGFAGVGMVATPLMALIVPPLQAAAIFLPILIVQDVISVWVYRRDRDAWNLKVLMPGGVVGVALAWLMAAHVSDAVVRLAVGLIGIGFVLNGWFGRVPAEARQPSSTSGVFWGGVSGFTSALVQAGSPPFQIFTLPQRMPKLVFVGTNAIFFAFINMLKIVPYFALNQFSAQTFEVSLWMLPLAIATNFLGIWLVRVTPTILFYRIAFVLVFLISLGLTWQAGRAFLHG